MEKDICYKYEFNFAKQELEVSEIYDYEDVEPLTIKQSINTLGESKFYMYSFTKDRLDDFYKGISEMLEVDLDAACRLRDFAYGRFSKFNEYWGKQI